MSFDIRTYGNLESDILLVQMVEGISARSGGTAQDDLEVIGQEVSFIREMSGRQDFCLKAVRVNNWNQDLSPWPAPAVFGNEDFGGGAAETLEYLLREIIPDSNAAEAAAKRIFIGGYSLAGLFALWAGYQTDRLDGIAAASPSVWFPSFTEYMRENEIRAKTVYLSLGDREERTRNPVMARVGDAVRSGFDILKKEGIDCILEWNRGNHFKEPDLRTAKAFAWLMNREMDRAKNPDQPTGGYPGRV